MHTLSDAAVLQRLNKDKVTEFGLAMGYTVVVIVFGIVGNIASVVFYGCKCHRTTTNVLIMYLAATDLFACVVFNDIIVGLCFMVHFDSTLGCQFLYFVNHALVTMSGCMLLVICVDRFRKLCRPYQWQFTFTRTKLIIGGVFLFSLVTSSRDFATIDSVHANITTPDTDRVVEAIYCTHSQNSDLKILITSTHVFDLVVFCIIIISMIVIYAIIAWTLWTYEQIKLKPNIKDLQMSVQTTKDKLSCPETEQQPCDFIETKECETCQIHKVTETKETDHENEIKTVKTLEPSETHQYNESGNMKRSNSYKLNSSSTTKNVKTCVAEDKNDTVNTITGAEGLDMEIDHCDSSECNNQIELTTIGTTKFNTCNEIKPSESQASHSSKTKKISRRHVERNVTIMMIAITAVSVLSYIPYLIVNITLKRMSDKPEQNYNVGIQIALRSYILNNAINPYITGIFNSDFRRFVKDSLKRFVYCTMPCLYRRKISL